jgi:sulfite exporter TauE/SafE
MFVIQPVIGVIHHKVYKRLQRRQIWSYLHLANGRVGITLGIINGGLGLHLAGASDYRKRVYAIVAAIMWALWMGVAVWAELRRVRRSRQATKSTAPVVTKVIGGERRESED